MRRTGKALAWGLALASCASDAPRATEVELLVRTDLDVPAAVDAIRVRVTGPDGREQTAEGALSGPGDLPSRVLLRYTEGELSPLSIVAEGLFAGEPVVTRRAEIRFVLREHRRLELALLASCVDVDCGDDTCTESGCQSPVLVPVPSSASERDAEPSPNAADAEP